MSRGNWSLTTMAAADLGVVHAIECQSPAPWSLRQLTMELETAGGCQLLCRLPDGSVAGFLLARTILDEAEILRLATDSRYRRCGAASRLLQFFIAAAEQLQVRKIHLELRAANAPALALYQKFAFEMTGRRPRYYTGPVDDALCLTRSFAS
jgi:ribosomal-protein-alanine N-acetyltransferase